VALIALTALLLFAAIAFYEWSPSKSRHQVQAWRLLKTSRQRPRRDYGAGDYVTRPELAEREFLPKERRKELSKP
jgi:hypothetical protein